MTNVCHLVRKNSLDNLINESNSWSEMCSVAEVLTWMAEINRGLCFSRNTTSRGRELLACDKVSATIWGSVHRFCMLVTLWSQNGCYNSTHIMPKFEEGRRGKQKDPIWPLSLSEKKKLSQEPASQSDWHRGYWLELGLRATFGC